MPVYVPQQWIEWSLLLEGENIKKDPHCQPACAAEDDRPTDRIRGRGRALQERAGVSGVYTWCVLKDHGGLQTYAIWVGTALLPLVITLKARVLAVR